MVYFSRACLRLLRSPQSRCTVTTASAMASTLVGLAEAEQLGGARIGVGLAMGHAHAATGGDIPAGDIAGRIDDGDEAEIVGEHVDVVRRRHRDHDLEFARQSKSCRRSARRRRPPRRRRSFRHRARSRDRPGCAASDGRRGREPAPERRACARDCSGVTAHMTLRLTSPQAAMELSSALSIALQRRFQVRLDDAVQAERSAAWSAACAPLP